MSRRSLYTMLAIGAIGTFLGHGAWALGAKDSFVELLAGSLDRLLGVTIAAGTAEGVVRLIGVADLAVAALILAMLVGARKGTGALSRLAYSRTALAVYAWGAIWGFVTAVSRMTAAGVFFPEVWDWVERAPNFMLPAALGYLVVKTRQEHPEAPLIVPESSHRTLETAGRR